MTLESIAMMENNTSVAPTNSGAVSADASALPAMPAEISRPQAVQVETPTGLRALVSHAFSLPVETPLETAQQLFSTHAMEFVAALEGGRPVGLCARRQVGIVLGFALWVLALRPQSGAQLLLLPEALVIAVTDSIHARYWPASRRARTSTFTTHDPLLVDEAGAFIGCIFARNLFLSVQHGLLLENLRSNWRKRVVKLSVKTARWNRS